jgi:transcriptional adapter 2-alpha
MVVYHLVIENGGIKYHCDYCKRDITDTVRVRCAECGDFDLCVECFSKGVEVGTHKNQHSYRLLDKYAFPILDADWGADEEWLLMEAIETYGMGNWADIADHVGTKTLEECADHYVKHYIDSPDYPLPKQVKLDEEKVTKARKERQSSPPKSNLPVIPPFKPKVMPSHPSNHEVQGFMPGRLEFDYEPENEAENSVKDLVFNEEDLPQDVDLKLALLEIYNSKLDIREIRKKFIFDRNLTQFKQLQATERKRSKEEKDLYQQTRVYSPLMTSADYESFVQGLLLERQLRVRIAQLQEYRRMGITSFVAADEYEVQKKHRLNSMYAKSPFVGSDRIFAKNQQHRMSTGDAVSTPSGGKTHSPKKNMAAGSSVSGAGGVATEGPKYVPVPLDLSGCEAVDQLTASEQAICSTLRLLPRAYLAIKQTLLKEAERRGGLKRREARTLVRIDVNKLGKVYDFFVSKGWLKQC